MSPAVLQYLHLIGHWAATSVRSVAHGKFFSISLCAKVLLNQLLNTNLSQPHGTKTAQLVLPPAHGPLYTGRSTPIEIGFTHVGWRVDFSNRENEGQRGFWTGYLPTSGKHPQLHTQDGGRSRFS